MQTIAPTHAVSPTLDMCEAQPCMPFPQPPPLRAASHISPWTHRQAKRTPPALRLHAARSHLQAAAPASTTNTLLSSRTAPYQLLTPPPSTALSNHPRCCCTCSAGCHAAQAVSPALQHCLCWCCHDSAGCCCAPTAHSAVHCQPPMHQHSH
jgi:hypothetical protein